MRAVFIFLLFLFALGLRLVLEGHPSLILCAVFWVILFLISVIARNFWSLPGFACNASATLANDGAMPVFNMDASGGFHVQGGPETALPFLCDRFIGFSIGDFLLLAGLVYALTRATILKHTRTKVPAIR